MIAAVILAAGSSSRFGRPKALLEFEGDTLLSRTIACARDGGCDPVLVVVGSDAELCREAASAHPIEIVTNPDWNDGMGVSIRRGIEALANRTGIRGALLLTCDQPLITPEVVGAIRTAFSRCSAVASGYAGIIGIPALFGASLFGELERLEGDRGARAILTRHADRVRTVDWPDGAVDIDRPVDYEALLGRS